MGVPDVLLGGNHAEINRWRLEQAKLRTMQRRPDLWDKYKQTHEE
jgi:tRNA (guanine37-N1)-methyltransferase